MCAGRACSGSHAWRGSWWLRLRQSEAPPPFCSSGRPVAHVPQALFLGGTPLGFATRGTQGEQFIGRAEPSVSIVQRTHLGTNLLAFKDCVTVLAAQQQILLPVARL